MQLRRILSTWIEKSLNKHSYPNKGRYNPFALYPFNGYGYQWWIPDESGDYMAIGVYNQFIYVSPKNNSVVVQLAANKIYGVDAIDTTVSEFESIAFLRTLANME